MEFYKLLLLQYINLEMHLNGFVDIIKYTGSTIKNIYDCINLLLNQNYIINNNSDNISITEKGKNALNENGMLYFEFYTTIKLQNINQPTKITDIYIPKNFLNKI